MGLGKFLAGAAGVVGAVVFAPVVLPVAATVGAGALATGAAAAGTVAAAASGVATAAGTVAAAAGTAVASSAVGGAAIAGMEAIGAGVAGVAGTVGLSAVATVAGTEAGAAAVGAIATGTAIGAGSALSGAGKMIEASDIKDQADQKLNQSETALEKAEESMNKALVKLGEVKRNIWGELDNYIEIVSKVKNVPRHGALSIDGSVVFDKMDMASMKNVSSALNSAITGGIASLAGGSLIGFATGSGLTSIATASTGTAIAGLNGAAATNASLAALGGGSLEVGGLGMAGGTIVANALAFAPAIAISGMMISKKGTKKLDSAKEYAAEVDKYEEEVKATSAVMKKLKKLSERMNSALTNVDAIFQGYFSRVVCMTNKTNDFREFTREEQQDFFVSVKLAKILTDLICTELMEEQTKTVKSEEVEKVICEYETVADKFR